ncbi:MAG: hypothetical protein ACYCWN_09755 [Ferrimicrobium sp.]|jgi:hypothetical protein|uniref:Uncharacterized protein n=1 Tax=Ferrimicrobium acidiphilum TaxID=121039 RepID=A0ABV3Y307_9ACTN|nr:MULTISPECIES: hypothetical protein [Ferrimicrobium]
MQVVDSTVRIPKKVAMRLGLLLDCSNETDAERVTLVHELIQCLAGDSATGDDQCDLKNFAEVVGYGGCDPYMVIERLCACERDCIDETITSLLELRDPRVIFKETCWHGGGADQ